MNRNQLAFNGPETLADLFERAVVKFRNNKLFGTKNQPGNGCDWITHGQVAEWMLALDWAELSI